MMAVTNDCLHVANVNFVKWPSLSPSADLGLSGRAAVNKCLNALYGYCSTSERECTAESETLGTLISPLPPFVRNYTVLFSLTDRTFRNNIYFGCKWEKTESKMDKDQSCNNFISEIASGALTPQNMQPCPRREQRLAQCQYPAKRNQSIRVLSKCGLLC
jgi:hypothetical protein